MKAIKNHGEKLIKAAEEHGKQIFESNAIIKKYDYDTEKDSPELLRQKEIVNLSMKGMMKY